MRNKTPTKSKNNRKSSPAFTNRNLTILIAAVVIVATAFIGIKIIGFGGASTPPNATYSIQVKCPTGGWCQNKTTIKYNPSKWNIRSWATCANGVNAYGGWHVDVGSDSYANCSTGIVRAGFEYGPTRQAFVHCWLPGDPRTGLCIGATVAP